MSYAGVSGHHRASSNWTRFASYGHHWWWHVDFWVWSGNQTPEQSVEVFDVAEAEESKALKFQKLSHVDDILRCERHRQQWVLATDPDDQSTNLQEDPMVYASLSVWEETRIVARQIIPANNALSIHKSAGHEKRVFWKIITEDLGKSEK